MPGFSNNKSSLSAKNADNIFRYVTRHDLLDLQSSRMYIVNQPLLAVVQAAASLSWTRDPFDRLIVGDALAANCPLLTKDDSIQANLPLAVW